ncbi:MAG: NAD(P)(+) transhydrogenase (Re/Si-specific) subunit alpha, partial [Solirubrobacterales bacterium]
MRIAVPKESVSGETRVAATPETVKKLASSGNEVVVQSGAGTAAGHPDSQFTDAGATIANDFAATVSGADAVVKVQKPSSDELAQLPEGSIFIGYLDPLTDDDTARALSS